MNYKENISRELGVLSSKPEVVFLGQGVINAGRIYDTLSQVPLKSCIEMPIAENLIMGTAIGLALDGWTPVVVFQRMDFMLVAADAIINHLGLLHKMSGGSLNPKVIIRAIIGTKSSSFCVGEQHNHDFTNVFRDYILTVRYEVGAYERAYSNEVSTLIVEERDEYKKELEACGDPTPRVV